MMIFTELSCLLGILVMGVLAWKTNPSQEQSFHKLPPATGDLKKKFKAFQTQYNKSYPNPAEHNRRFHIFLDNLAKAQRLTEEHGGLAQFGVTQFSDLTEKEFLQLFQSLQPSSSDQRPKLGGCPRMQKLQIRSCNWMKAGVLSLVKYQKGCKICWAIAAVDNVEALWAINHKQLFNLSVQEVLDCRCHRRGSKGCNVREAFRTILNQNGLVKAEDYPYTARPSPNGCQNKKKWAQIQSFLPFSKKDEDDMAQYVAEKGPITVVIYSSLLQNYRKGMIQPKGNCNTKPGNHRVLLVGFGQKQGFPYWILRNSWGSEWGEQGYFRLHRGSDACSITRDPVTAVVEEGHGSQLRIPASPLSSRMFIPYKASCALSSIKLVVHGLQNELTNGNVCWERRKLGRRI